MKSISNVCPDCIEPLVKDIKQLGECKNWYVCPRCGYRERPSREGVANALANHTSDRIKFRNSQQNR